MAARMTWLSGALFGLALLAMPVAVHLALMPHGGMAVAGVLVALQAGLVTWIVTAPLARPILRVSVSAVSILLVAGLSRFADGGRPIAFALPHAMAYAALLALFLASLAPGREAVATLLARMSRGYLPPEVVRYTRRVTWAWCCFFAAQLVGSALLLVFAPLEVWSVFINLCNLPLIGVMFCAEYAYRQWRHAARPPERIADMLRVFRQIRTVPISEDR
jgi:uncharacterized membrane protein